MESKDDVIRTDVLSLLTEADRQRRTTRVFTRSGVAGADGMVGRAVGYRLGRDAHAMVFRVDGTQNDVVVDFADIARVELV